MLLPVTKMFHDCPLAPCPMHLPLAFRNKLAWHPACGQKKKRGWMRLPWDAAWPHMHWRMPLSQTHAFSLPLTAPSFLMIKPLLPKQKNKEKEMHTERERQAISPFQAGQASEPMQLEACCIDYVVDRPRYSIRTSLPLHHIRLGFKPNLPLTQCTLFYGRVPSSWGHGGLS